ncbi:MAG: AAA family ATPase [Candidatus Methanomethylophilaceae archaeon]|nr:AAA family ATPase [Candidatus Methanomethylophilaceae archaeon]
MRHFDYELMRGIPIGVSDFMEVRNLNGLYVDKTELIIEILDQPLKKVFLFTRPRRFGKTMNMSMLEAFFDLKYKGNPWFEGLRIDGREDLSEHKNVYPVIYLSMKDLEADNLESFIRKMSSKMMYVFLGFRYVLDSEIDPMVAKKYGRILSEEADQEELVESLHLLSMVLHEHHGIQPIILIDEYDNPVNCAFDKGSMGGIIDFLRGFYSRALKDNRHLRFAVLTGVMQIAKESIFSGLNNIHVNNIFSEDFDECFGFTEAEVRAILEEVEHPEKFEECREWYDGYRFGKADVYNPWSVNSYVDSGFKPKEYWGGTSGNDIIGTLLDFADAETFEELTALGGGGTVEKQLSPAVPIRGLYRSKDAVYSVMAMAGYLNAVPSEEGYVLSIPNKEVRRVFFDVMMERSGTSAGLQLRNLFRALEKGDVEGVEKNAFSVLAENFKSIQLKDEGDYQLLIAGAALALLGNYKVRIEEEAGNGRADLIMERTTPERPNIVVEFKRSRSDDPEDWAREAEEGVAQIKEKDYHLSLRGRTLLYGVCFRNKKAKAAVEELPLPAARGRGAEQAPCGRAVSIRQFILYKNIH